ncbi:MAG: hypothetical protein IIA72_16230 [Proteobacteria bacterium]|nr:hypothetical protein [Pseudomonadota bacterium]
MNGHFEVLHRRAARRRRGPGGNEKGPRADAAVQDTIYATTRNPFAEKVTFQALKYDRLRLRTFGIAPAGNRQITTAALHAMNEGLRASRGSVRAIEIVPPTGDEPKNHAAQATDQYELQRGDKHKLNGIRGTRNIEVTILIRVDDPKNGNSNTCGSPKKYVIFEGRFTVFNEIYMVWQTK